MSADSNMTPVDNSINIEKNNFTFSGKIADKSCLAGAILGDSDCACGESSERKVVLLDKMIKSSPADLKKFRSLCET